MGVSLFLISSDSMHKKATAIHTNDQWQIDNIVIFYLCIVADGDSWLLSKENINTTESSLDVGVWILTKQCPWCHNECLIDVGIHKTPSTQSAFLDMPLNHSKHLHSGFIVIDKCNLRLLCSP